MNEISNKLAERAERKSRKRDEKRQQIAASAIEALTQLGYANTSMRDIASVSDMSLGMLSYYFADKSDLIIYCVTNYKSAFVRANEDAIEVTGDRDAVIASFTSGLASSIKKDAAAHRLWYDIRAQAMFDEAFRQTVEQIEEDLVGMVEHLHKRLDLPSTGDIMADYAAIDGVFRYWIQNDERSEKATEAEIRESFHGLIDRLWPGGGHAS